MQVVTDKEVPTVKLGDSEKVEVGDKVIAIGYPGIASAEATEFSSSSDLVPSVTSGIISAKRKQPDNTNVYQIDAPTEHGNSGGPAFDENGDVIGITTWGSISEQGIGAQGYNFIIPINDARIDSKYIIPSKITDDLVNGLNEYWQGNNTAADNDFNVALKLNPKNYYANTYKQMVENPIGE